MTIRPACGAPESFANMTLLNLIFASRLAGLARSLEATTVTATKAEEHEDKVAFGVVWFLFCKPFCIDSFNVQHTACVFETRRPGSTTA